MEIKLSVSFDNEAIAVMKDLTAAIKSASGNSVGSEALTGSTTKTTTTKASSGPVFWQNSRSGEFGESADAEAFEKLRAAAPKFIGEISKDVYDQLVATADEEIEAGGGKDDDADEKAAAEEKAKAAADAKKKAAADKKAADAKKKAAADKKAEAHPSQDDIKALALDFLNKDEHDLDDDEYESRKEFMRNLAARYGAPPSKVTDAPLRSKIKADIEKRVEDPDYDLADSDLNEEDDLV